MEAAQYNDYKHLLHSLLNMGELFMASGAEIMRIEDTMRRMGLAAGCERMNVFCITSNIVVTMDFSDGTEITQTRRIRVSSSNNFSTLEALNALSREYCREPFPVAELDRRIREIEKIQLPKGRLYFGSLLAVFFSTLFFGGNLAEALASIVFGGLVCIIQEKIKPYTLNDILYYFVSAFSVGTAICITARLLPFLNQDAIIIGDIMLLIPGISFTNSVRDLLLGDTISGIMRIIETVLLAFALAMGFMGAFLLVGRF